MGKIILMRLSSQHMQMNAHIPDIVDFVSPSNDEETRILLFNWPGHVRHVRSGAIHASQRKGK